MTNIHCLIHSEAGEGHTNADVVGVRPYPSNADVLLCALADGQGGQVCVDDVAGYCSLVSLCISEWEVCGASCGDSGALLLSGGREILLTEGQRKNPPVGSSAAHPVAFSARLQPGQTLLVVSDGVWKYVGWEHIATMAAHYSGLDLIAALRRAAWDASGGRLPDDFGIALLHGQT